MRQRWQEEEWTGGRETGHWTYKGEFGVGGAVIMTMIESRAKTGAGSWDHLA